MKVSDWLKYKDMDPTNKTTPLLNDEIISEINSYNIDFFEYIKKLHKDTTFKHNYLFSYIITDSGYCIGFNENPTGYSTPVCRIQK